ncbi:peptidylprolyl isomerase [Lactobacillus delbrueckii subsp. lactis]|jgi:peptidyl-prolyl cis-trans isomerase B (cyclophilin B)|uniref:peptidylprolyl isomerase n=1 Tax=Lactobacillus delbrueckii TaxID=1584 RepID=UPI0001EC327E|nr:peptidylprolyl isomerase [Lactobacillus delbrueckii]ADQ61065.1 Peptidyl-prolyl cis-trans isomerase [Lactobacillus delbrueckii subsp. bulgaricus ND02]MBN6089442.1 peptidylprolyl isomerase [Lactobacillus delbrueckii subsp. bulgaricus]MBO3081974.1 peptidylprolyl isomerase [Lactobacillus delbrueckii subsp. bulgaricus]MCD5438439.1 peptidylprolyl isomerase [Lactobacillus delbrueckii subsp. lactis]MCD5469011.1 peptidylprolyl isomerase [Lactobacillus delbrueckii subsp. lactis]
MSEYPQLNLDQAKGPKATIKTNHGDIVIQLFPGEAPMTVENFVRLAQKGYYDGVTFHRVISDFMIQGGDPEGTGAGGQSIWGHNFEDEFSNELFNLRGALSMANAGPNTNGSQFFIVQNKNMPKRFIQQLRDAQYPEEVVKAYKQGGTPWLDHRHTVFGHVTEGMDVVDEIAKVAKDGNDKPLEDVVITTVEIAD